MKTKLYILSVLFITAAFFTSCKDEDVIPQPEETYYLQVADSCKSFLASIDGVEKEIAVSSNLDLWTASVESAATPWCSVQKTGSNLKVTVRSNNGNPFRYCTITLSGSNVDAQTITVYQLGDSDASSISADVQVPVSDANASEFQPGTPISNSYDGNMSTNYHSKWSPTTFPVTLEYLFSDAERIDYVIYYPRTEGANGNFGQLEVWYKAGGNNTYVKYGDYDFGKSGSPSVVSFSNGLINPTAIKFVVRSGYNDFVSCAEMMFYKRNTANITPDVFTDNVCSELKPGTTLEQINAIANPFLKNLAMELYAGNYPMEFRVQEYKPYPYPNVLSATNKTSTYSILDNPTGMCLTQEGEEFVVFLAETNQKVNIRIVDWRKGFAGVEYVLTPGMNKIKSTKKGLIYVMYHTSDPAAQPVKIHIAKAHVNGYFDTQKHQASDWNRLLNTAVDLHFDVLGQYAHLCFPTQSFKQYTPDGKLLVAAYDELVRLEQDFMGLFKYNRLNKNRMFFQGGYEDMEFKDFFMYASEYRTNYNVYTMPELCNVNTFKTTSIWGPAHEVGHVNQTRPGLDWLGMTEVTNNIYSLYIQTSFGNTSRLEADNRYEKAFTNFVDRDTARFGAFGDVFCQLIPFWQLQLYFAKVKNYPDFYKDLHEAVRTQANPATAGACQLNFVKLCCDVSETDLTDFFTAWGFLSSIYKMLDDYGSGWLEVTPPDITAVKSYIADKHYPKPNVPLHYLTDSNVGLFKNPANIVKGSMAIMPPNNQAVLQGWQNVLVFEAYDGSELKLVTPGRATVSFKASGYTDLKIMAVALDGTRMQVYPIL